MQSKIRVYESGRAEQVIKWLCIPRSCLFSQIINVGICN